MIPFRFTGPHPLVFEIFGTVEPDDVLPVGDEYVEKFMNRSDMECQNFDGLAELLAMRESEAQPDGTAPASEPPQTPATSAPQASTATTDNQSAPAGATK